MVANEIEKKQVFSKSVHIQAPVSAVWSALTSSEAVKMWMSEEDLEIETDWLPGSSIVIKGTAHWVYFEDKGIILRAEPLKVLQYSHLSSLSNLPDLPESYCILDFRLTELKHQTILSLDISNFPTTAIYKHFQFYWNTTLDILKTWIENNQNLKLNYEK